MSLIVWGFEPYQKGIVLVQHLVFFRGHVQEVGTAIIEAVAVAVVTDLTVGGGGYESVHVDFGGACVEVHGGARIPGALPADGFPQKVANEVRVAEINEGNVTVTQGDLLGARVLRVRVGFLRSHCQSL